MSLHKLNTLKEVRKFVKKLFKSVKAEGDYIYYNKPPTQVPCVISVEHVYCGGYNNVKVEYIYEDLSTENAYDSSSDVNREYTREGIATTSVEDSIDKIGKPYYVILSKELAYKCNEMANSFMGHLANTRLCRAIEDKIINTIQGRLLSGYDDVIFSYDTEGSDRIYVPHEKIMEYISVKVEIKFESMHTTIGPRYRLMPQQ